MQETYKNNFNLIRLFAAMQVLLVHSLNHFGAEGPFVALMKATPGVPIFFFISGYLIAGSYKRKHREGVIAFFRNRFLRIYPGLIACVLVSTAAVAATGFFEGKNIGVTHFVAWMLGQSTVLQFYNPEFMRSFGVGVLNGALWTISVELQFYFLVPLLFYFHKANKIALIVIFVVSIVFNLLLRGHADSEMLAVKLLHVSFAPWLYMFLFGLLLSYHDDLARKIRQAPLVIVGLVYIASMNLIGGYTINAQNAINPVAFFALACLIFKLAMVNLTLPYAFKDFINKNDFSYGLYLYHMPVINLLLYADALSRATNIVITVLIGLALSVMSWYLVESPALKLKRSDV